MDEIPREIGVLVYGYAIGDYVLTHKLIEGVFLLFFLNNYTPPYVETEV